jgi:hypothetical protein
MIRDCVCACVQLLGNDRPFVISNTGFGLERAKRLPAMIVMVSQYLVVRAVWLQLIELFVTTM